MTSLFDHKVPTPEPEDDPLPPREPEPIDDPVPHPDPVISPAPYSPFESSSYQTRRINAEPPWQASSW